MSLVGVHRFTMLARVFTGLQSRSLHLAASKNVSGNWVVVNAHRHQRYRNWQPVIAATLVRHASDAAPKVFGNGVHMTGLGTMQTDKALDEFIALLHKNNLMDDSTRDNIKSISYTNATSIEIPQDKIDLISDVPQVDNIVTQIPEPPTPPAIQDIVEAAANTGSNLTELGLGGWTPPGMIQQALDLLHTQVGLPWWATIVCSTVAIRCLLLPIVIKIQRYAANMHNVQPEMQYIQAQLTEARKMGDQMEVMRLSGDMYRFMKEKNINPLTNAGLPLLQAPIFLSFFWALRGMVRAPVHSMADGGLFWFQDLTLPDPFYALPLITSVTLFTTIELGTDSVRIQSMGNMRHVMRALPIVMFPFIMNFESAILCYWVSTNVFSLIQVAILRIPKVRTYFKIPETINHDAKALPITKKKFVEGFKDSWTNMKVAREASARNIYDETVFEKAGKGPVPKTYKYDPTKPRNPNVFLSKKRD
ncbi:hypothetical protein TKK_0001813 [Trichogramma kaykai]|uniref:Membrane insertase YidC/Oxa/ALB C-terminal domain-containing protein n=1 Tax=Trichogramma kaykai TaxID=54128 RepID=A0ABD2XGG9_9HYME